MRSITAVSMVFLLGCGPAGHGGGAGGATGGPGVVIAGHGGTDSGGAWIAGAPIHTQVLAGDGGEVYVGVWVAAPQDPQAVVERAPMAVSLVVDTSGSMSGDKIAHARMASASLLESLADGDLVSVYAFDTQVREIAPPTLLGPGTRGALMRAVGSLEARGMTNLYGGLAAGVAHMQKTPPTHPIRRIMMISDGQANVGPSDPVSLGNLAVQATEYGAQVTSIGVGLDYDENTLGALSVRTAGRLYHLEQPFQMAQIIESELNLLAQTIGVDAYIEVIPTAGVIILSGETLGAEVKDGRLRVPLGSVYAGQQREVLFRARVDTASPGSKSLAEARLVYRPASGEAAAPTVHAAPLRYEVTRDRATAEASVHPRVSAMVTSHQVARAQLRAAEHLNRGDTRAAVEAYDFADDAIAGALERPMPAAERQRLEQRRKQIHQTRERARSATDRDAARGAALESHDAAYADEGY